MKLPIKTDITEQINYIEVTVHDFKTNNAGNPVAHHCMHGWKGVPSGAQAPYAGLGETRQRQDVGYNSERDDYVPTLFRKAGVPISQFHFSHMIGSRAEDNIKLVYVRSNVAWTLAVLGPDGETALVDPLFYGASQETALAEIRRRGGMVVDKVSEASRTIYVRSTKS